MIIAICLTAGNSLVDVDRGDDHGKRIGNGISLIIFAGIVARIPAWREPVFEYLRAGTASYARRIAVCGYRPGNDRRWCLERRPAQTAGTVCQKGCGQESYGGQSTFLPLKVNTAGVIPIIFAMSIMMFPGTIASWFQNSAVSNWMNAYFHFGSPLYNTLYALLIVFFTFFYTSVIFNPLDVADNIKKYGGFIPGIVREADCRAIDRILGRLTLAEVCFTPS